MVGHGKIFKIEVLRWRKNAIFRFDFANAVLYKRAMLLIFYAECTESVLGILP